MIFLKTSKIFSTATRLIFAQNYKGQMQKPLSPPSPALMERALWTGHRSLLPALMPSANPFALFRLHLSFTFLFKNQTSLAFTSNLPESELKQPKNVNSCQMLDSSKKKKSRKIRTLWKSRTKFRPTKKTLQETNLGNHKNEFKMIWI